MEDDTVSDPRLNLPMQTCVRCGQQWFTAHYCPALNQPFPDGAKPIRTLTEEDVRRIVREELARTPPTTQTGAEP